MTNQEEPSVPELAELWARMEQIRKEHLRTSNLDPATFEGDERKAQKLAKLEIEHLAVLKALGIADDDLFDPFKDVPRPTSADQAQMADLNGIASRPARTDQVKPESPDERNSRWLKVWDEESPSHERGSQNRAITRIQGAEQVNRNTVKKGLQVAKKARKEAYREGVAVQKAPKKIPATPFSGLPGKG